MIHFKKDQVYWLENLEMGTLRGTLILLSTNGLSLGFALDETIMFRGRGASGGMMIGRFLALINDNGTLVDIMSEQQWTVYETEPAVKIPTK